MRERRRAETVREIKQAALAELAAVGPGALSLRAVARAVGMTVQSLYHYFPSRDALLTALVTDAHHALADAVQDAADATRGRPPAERHRATRTAFREWALTHRARFLLLYGTPVPGFVTEDGAAIGTAARRLAAPFADAVFDGWTPEEIAAVPLAPGAEGIGMIRATFTGGGIPLPPGALAWFLELRSRLHGIVILELNGHLQPLQAHADDLFAAATHRVSLEIDAEHARAQAALRKG